MDKNKWLCLVLGLVIILALLVTSCAEKVEEVTPVKIGSTVVVTGPVGRLGQAMPDGHRLAVADFNLTGGIVYGGVKHPIEYKNYDTKWDTATGVKGIRKLIFEDKVNFIHSSVRSDIALAQAEISEAEHAITITGGWTSQLLGPDKPYSFRITVGNMEPPWVLYKWIREIGYPQAKTVAMTGTDYLTTDEYLEQLRIVAPAYGFDLIHEGKYPQGTTDFYPVITALLAKNPDLIDIDVSANADQYLIIKQLRELGYNGPIVSIGDITPADLIKAVGDAAEGYVNKGVDWSAPMLGPKANAFYNRAMEEFGECTYVTATGYNTVWAFKQAIEGADSVDVDAVVSWFENNDLETLFGVSKWGGESTFGNNHQLMAPVGFMQIQSGVPKMVAFESAPRAYVQ